MLKHAHHILSCLKILTFCSLIGRPGDLTGYLELSQRAFSKQTINRFGMFILQRDFVNLFFFVLGYSLSALAVSVPVLLEKKLIKMLVTQRRKTKEISHSFPRYFLEHEHTNKYPRLPESWREQHIPVSLWQFFLAGIIPVFIQWYLAVLLTGMNCV